MKSSKVGSSMDRAQISLIWSQALKKRAHSTFFRSDGKLWGHWKSDLAWEKKHLEISYGDIWSRKKTRSCSAPDSSEASVNGTGSDSTDVVGSATRRKFEWRMVWPNKPGPVQARAGCGRAVHEVNLKVVHGQIFVSVSFGAEIFGAVFVKMLPKKFFGRAEIFFDAATLICPESNRTSNFRLELFSVLYWK